MKRERGQVWLLLAALLLAAALKLAYPALAAQLRQQTAAVFAADVQKLALVEALGRSLAEEKPIAALMAQRGETGA